MKSIILVVFWFVSGNLFAQTDLISWRKLDTPVLGIVYEAPQFKRIQAGDLVDNLGVRAWFTDSFNKAQRDHEILYPNGNQKLLTVQLEARTVLTNKTFHDLVFTQLNDSLDEGEDYLLSMTYIWYYGSYNSDRLFVSFLTDAELMELVKRDFKKPSKDAIWHRPDTSFFKTEEYENTRFKFTAKGGEKYLLIGSPKVNNRISKQMRKKKAFDYWGRKINALRLAFSQISVFKVSQVDTVVYNYKIGESEIERLLPIQEFNFRSIIDSISITGYADTIGLNDSLNLVLAQKRALNLYTKYSQKYPDYKIIQKAPMVMNESKNRKAKVVIYRTLVIE